MWHFYYFNFERNDDILKPKSPCSFLNKNIKFNKNDTESKTENPKHSFRETNLVLQFIEELQTKSKTVMSLNSKKIKDSIFLLLILSEEI